MNINIKDEGHEHQHQGYDTSVKVRVGDYKEKVQNITSSLIIEIAYKVIEYVLYKEESQGIGKGQTPCPFSKETHKSH